MLPTRALDYDLPEDLIATEPARPRDSARLLVISRADPSPARAQHLRIRDLPPLLEPSDLLILNRTAVLPARFRGVREDSGGKVDGLYLEQARHDDPLAWSVLLKSRRTKPGIFIRLLLRDGARSPMRLRLVERNPDSPDSGQWIARVEGAPEHADTPAILAMIGLTPLPPYIRQARKRSGQHSDDERDREDYQTVYAAPDRSASVAAPTAGLHFTPELLARLRERGVQTAEVTLHVGIGTFKPIETEYVEQHPMHSEWCTVPRETLGAIGDVRARAGRVIAVGTTAARALESVNPDEPAEGPFRTSLLIKPGHDWRNADGLLTNFHLPRSTLLAMVASLFPRGMDDLLPLYAEAIERRYRFYSFGDAMLILP